MIKAAFSSVKGLTVSYKVIVVSREKGNLLQCLQKTLHHTEPFKSLSFVSRAVFAETPEQLKKAAEALKARDNLVIDELKTVRMQLQKLKEVGERSQLQEVVEIAKRLMQMACIAKAEELENLPLYSFDFEKILSAVCEIQKKYGHVTAIAEVINEEVEYGWGISVPNHAE